MSEKSGRSDWKLSESSSISELQAADLSIFSGSFDGGVFSSNLLIFDLMGARNQNNSLYSPHPFVKSNGPCRLTAITQSSPKKPLNMTPADFGLADYFTANNSSFVGNFQSNVRSTRLLPSWAVDMSGSIRDDLTLQDVVRNGSLIDFAMDRTGVKFLESHFPSEQDDEMHSLLFDKLTEQSTVFTSLCRSAAGNFIIQKFVEHASLEEQDRLVSTMSENGLIEMCLDKFACRVVQLSIQKFDESIAMKLVHKISTLIFLPLCTDQCAIHVLQKVVKLLPIGAWSFFVKFLCRDDNLMTVCQDKYGCRLVQQTIDKLSVNSNTHKLRLNEEQDKKQVSEETDNCIACHIDEHRIDFWSNGTFAGGEMCHLDEVHQGTRFSLLIPSLMHHVRRQYGENVSRRDIYFLRIWRSNIGASRFIDITNTVEQIWRDIPDQEKHVWIRYGTDKNAVRSAVSDYVRDFDDNEDDGHDKSYQKRRRIGLSGKNSGALPNYSAGAKGVVVSTKNEKGRPAKAVTTSSLSKTPVSSVRSLAKNSRFSKFQKLAQRRAAAIARQAIRNNNAFLRTQRGIGKRFSTEKFNLKKVNSPKYIGLANKHALDVSAGAKGVVVSTKNEKGRPAKAVTTSSLSKTPVSSVRSLAKNSRFSKFQKLAQRRAAAIVRSQVKKAKVPKTDA